jgi:hypothetical protein
MVQGKRVNHAFGSKGILKRAGLTIHPHFVIARSVSDEAIQGKYRVNTPWIASPASRDAGSQ